MRTTLSIDDHLLAEVKLIAARSNRTIGSVVEDALRRMLADHEPRPGGEPHRLPLYTYDPPGVRPGVDLLDREQVEGIVDDGRTHVLP